MVDEVLEQLLNIWRGFTPSAKDEAADSIVRLKSRRIRANCTRHCFTVLSVSASCFVGVLCW
jgi:hypothetical protein